MTWRTMSTWARGDGAKSKARQASFAFVAVAIFGSLFAFPLECAAKSFPTKDHFVARSLLEPSRNGLGIADGGATRPLLPVGMDLIKDFEGWSSEAYNDPVGLCTIGYGHLIAKQKCELINPFLYPTGVTTEQGAELLDTDTKTARAAVQQLVTTPLTDQQFSALSAFVFNVGSSQFATSTMLKLINAEELQLATNQFGRWVKSKGQVLPGLVERRACEAALFQGQIQDNPKKPFKRALCSSLGAAPSAGELIDIDIGE